MYVELILHSLTCTAPGKKTRGKSHKLEDSLPPLLAKVNGVLYVSNSHLQDYLLVNVLYIFSFLFRFLVTILVSAKVS